MKPGRNNPGFFSYNKLKPKTNYTMYETMILTIDVSTFSDGRKLAEHLENRKFDSFGELTKP